MRFVRFRPARPPPGTPPGVRDPLPNIRLDRAIEFLIGDRLA
jgi:predicted YcjX-like family ATPase